METIIIRPISAAEPAVQALIHEIDAYHNALYPAESNHLDDTAEMQRSNVYFLGAFQDEKLVGCGAVKKVNKVYGEIKRLYVRPEARGRGISKRLMVALEAHLVAEGIALARLETGVAQPAALGLYESLGYRRREPFGGYREDPLSIFMEKGLGR